uniref:Uncharacterized protein n=1 Tax=Rhizophora mucronata TaxID=61149 RepID=A0A2P2PV53_RHIMU
MVVLNIELQAVVLLFSMPSLPKTIGCTPGVTL